MACTHDWRIRKEKPWLREPTAEEIAEARAEHDRLDQSRKELYGSSFCLAPFVPPTSVQQGTVFLWYCARCRKLDTTHKSVTWGD